MTGEVPSPQLAVAEAAAADKPAAAPAFATTPAAAKPSSGSGGLFGSLFASKSTDTKPAEPGGSAIDRMARLVGLRGNDKETKAAEAPPPPKPKPAAKPTSVASHGAIRPRQAEAEPVKTTEAQAPAASAAPAAAPVRAAVPAAAPANTAMNGAAPVVQTGSFDSRWSGFR
jgi:hypothetical protein